MRRVPGSTLFQKHFIPPSSPVKNGVWSGVFVLGGVG